MFVGVLRLVLSVPGARSLKDRRRVVHALRDRIRARLSASIAEVGNLELYQVATLGVCVVSRSSRRCSELMSEVVSLAQNQREALVSDIATEIVAFGAGGSAIRGGIEQTLDRDAGPTEDEDES